MKYSKLTGGDEIKIKNMYFNENKHFIEIAQELGIHYHDVAYVVVNDKTNKIENKTNKIKFEKMLYSKWREQEKERKYEQIYDLYYNKHLRVKEIAEAVGYTPSNVSKILVTYQVGNEIKYAREERYRREVVEERRKKRYERKKLVRKDIKLYLKKVHNLLVKERSVDGAIRLLEKIIDYY